MSTQSTIRVANRYRIIRKLGQGGMGVVYHVHDDLIDRPVALKQVLIPADQLQFNNSMGTSNIYLALATEFRTLANLRHPYIVQVLDYGFDSAGNPFFTMEYVPDAQPITEAALKADFEFQIQSFGQMLSALVYLHRRGIIHRDLKPGNVLVDTNRTVRVLDFGLALESRPSQNDTSAPDGTVVGTLAYMAPEILERGHYGVASDLFAVGIMAYEIFARQHPFDKTSVAKLVMDIISKAADVSVMDDRLANWVGHLLEKDPNQRPQSAQTALGQLYAAVSQELPAQDTAVRESFLRASRFVGRKAELAQLTDAMAAITAEDPIKRQTAILLGGESGVGKSRLLEEARTRALIKGFRVLRGQAVEGGASYQIWRDIVRPLLLSTSVSDLEAGILKEIIPDIERLLGRTVLDIPELNGQANLTRLNLTIIDVLKYQTQPLLIIFEDVQWAEHSLDALQLLLRLLDQFAIPVMVLASYRSDEAPTLPATLSSMQLVSLQRLDRDAVRKLAVSMLGEAGDNDELLTVLERETEGNVFFIVEVMRALAEVAGSLERVAEAGLPVQIVAGGMNDILRRRLNSMPEVLHEMLLLAAIIGRQLDTRLLKEAFPTQDTEAFITAGANCAIFDFVDDHWRFAHDKLRETLLANLLLGRRAQLNRIAAEAIEATYPNDIDYAETLVTLWQGAGDPAKAVHYTLIAGRHMLDFTAEYDKAEQLINRAFDIVDMLDDALAYRVRLDALMGDLHYCRANWTAAERAYHRSLAGASEPSENWIYALNKLAQTLSTRGKFDEAEMLATRILETGTSSKDKRAESLAYMTLGRVAESRGDYSQAQIETERALEAAQEAGDKRLEALWLTNLAVSYGRLGNHIESEKRLLQSLDFHRQSGDRLNQAIILGNLGYKAQLTGKLNDAEQRYRAALDIYQEIGSDFQADMLNNLGMVATERGEYSVAIPYFDHAIDIYRKTGDHARLIETLNSQTHALLYQGNLPDAVRNLNEGIILLNDVKSKPKTLMTLMQVAHLRQTRGNYRDAVSLIAFIEAQPETGLDFANLHLAPIAAKLKATVDAASYQAWMKLGQNFDLDTVMATIKDELATDDN